MAEIPACHIHQPPEVLVLGPSSFIATYDKEFSSRFRVMRSWESPLPLSQFLAAEAQDTQAALSDGGISVSADMLRSLPSLRLLVTSSAGINHIDLVECRRRGIAVANAPKIFSADVADLAVGLLIDVMRKITAADRFVKSGLWTKQGAYPVGSKLSGKRIGIVGLGSIGLEVAKRLEPFHCAMSYYSRNKKPSISYDFYSDIMELASASDVLIISCALTEQTRHLINREVMLALGKEGVIVNIARGAVIDEKQMVSCLQQGEIGGAGLDVFEDEPHVPEQLFELENVVLTSHYAFYTDESARETYELMSRNIEAFFANKPLLSPVFVD